MAMNLHADSEVVFKDKPEGKEVKMEGAPEDATIRVELKKFSLRLENYHRKGDIEGWVNQFEEYAMLG